MPKILIVGAGLDGQLAAIWLGRNAPHIEFQLCTTTGGPTPTLRLQAPFLGLGPGGLLRAGPHLEKLLSWAGCKGQPMSEDLAHLGLLFRHRLSPFPQTGMELLNALQLGPVLSARGLLHAGRFRVPDLDLSIGRALKLRLGSSLGERLAQLMVNRHYFGHPDLASLKDCFPELYKRCNSRVPIAQDLLKSNQPTPQNWLGDFKNRLYISPEQVLKLSETISSHSGNVKRLLKLRQRSNHAYDAYLSGAPEKGEYYDGLILAPDCKRIVAYLPPELGSIARYFDCVASTAVTAVKLVYEGMLGEHFGWGYNAPRQPDQRHLGLRLPGRLSPEEAPNELWMLFDDYYIQDLNNAQLMTLACDELQSSLSLLALPTASTPILRSTAQIPQWIPGHAGRLEHLEDTMSTLGTLEVVGTHRSGWSVEQRLADMESCLPKLITSLGRH